MAGYRSDDDDDLFLALQNMEPCANCGKPGARVPCMSGCNLVYYCSQECMMNNASAHRLRCRNLRCSKFNDSEDSKLIVSKNCFWESNVDDHDHGWCDLGWCDHGCCLGESDNGYESFSDESVEDSDSDDGENVKPTLKKKSNSSVAATTSKLADVKKVKSSKNAKNSSGKKKRDSTDLRISMNSDVEKRIEEKIMRRLKQQEENRIALAIEQRMLEEHANWKGEEMNRIALEVKKRLQEEQLKNEAAEDNLLQTMAKSKVLDEPAQERLKKKVEHKFRRQLVSPLETGERKNEQVVSTTIGGNMKMEENLATAPTTTSSTTSTQMDNKEWSNRNLAFKRLKIAVWKEGRLGLLFIQNPSSSGEFTMVGQVSNEDCVARRANIYRGDVLLSINGETTFGLTHSKIMHKLEHALKPAILKFESAKAEDISEYVVKWINGPLGLTLMDDGSVEALPIVHRLTRRPGSTAQRAHVAIGDILVAINNIDTVALGCTLSMSVLKKVQLPAKLRFRGVGGKPSPPPSSLGLGSYSSEVPLNLNVNPSRYPSSTPVISNEAYSLRDTSSSVRSSCESKPTTYEILWEDGPLGLTIIPGEVKDDLPVVKRVTGKGRSSGLEYSQVGDRLVSINSETMEKVPFEDVVYKLKNIEKPVTLVMESCKNPCSTLTSSYARSEQESMEGIKLPYRASVPTANLGDDEYEIIWGDGPLGMTIDSASHNRTYIKRLSKKGASASLDDSAVGDQVIEVNGMDVSSKLFSDVVQMLKVVSKPAKLRFRKEQLDRSASFSIATSKDQRKVVDQPSSYSSSSTRTSVGNDYQLFWSEGPLGMSLHAGATLNDFPYINRLTGLGCAGHLPQSAIGDHLIEINGRSIAEESFNSVMQSLKDLPKPISLKFRSSSRGGGSGGSGSSGGSSGGGVLKRHPSLPLPSSGRESSSNNGSVRSGAARKNSEKTPDIVLQVGASDGCEVALTSPKYNSKHIDRSGSIFGNRRNPLDDQTEDMESDSSCSSGIHEGGNNSGFAMTPGTSSLLRGDSATNEKFSQLHTPFLGGAKLSSGRRQKIAQSVKK